MNDTKYVELLKEINNRAVEVIKEIENENDDAIKQAIITEFSNDAFQKGVEYGQSKK